MKNNILLFVLLITSIHLFAQQYTPFWSDLNEAAYSNSNIHFKEYRLWQMNASQLLQTLERAPMERNEAASSEPLVMALPFPDGSIQIFEVVETQIMQENLARKYDYFKTYTGKGITDRTAIVHFDWTANGFHAYVLSSKYTVFIQPVNGPDDEYISAYKVDGIAETEANRFTCGTSDAEINAHQAAELFQSSSSARSSIGETLRTFRIAIATTAEFTGFYGSVEETMAALVTTVNRLNNVYERDLSVRFVLIDNNDALIFTDAASDPYDNDNQFVMLGQNVETLDNMIGFNNFDIAHVFARENLGGVASFVGNVCTYEKAGGVTGVSDPTSYILISTFSHEIGHQMGASHTWNNCTEDLNFSQRSPGTAVEPGSGSTIMSYGGRCSGGTDFININEAQDNYHGVSMIQIAQNISGYGSCYEESETGNTPPEVFAVEGDGKFIPINTPFELTGSGSDVQGDLLTYSWEQFDTGPISPLGEPEGTSPSFRALEPSESPTRLFPDLISLLFNLDKPEEVLPSYSRGLNFNVIVRDNHEGGGGTAFDEIQFFATEAAGPFLVTYPNATDIIWETFNQYEVNWDVANTDGGAVNCPEVDIYLSYNNGVDWPVLLADNTPNDGSAMVTIPDSTTIRGRIKVKCSDNIFFNITSTYFKIEQGITSVEDLNSSDDIRIYPNPASTQVQIHFDNPTEEVTVSAINSQGQHIISSNYKVINKVINIDVNNFSTGVYYLKIQMRDSIITRKVLIQ